MLDIQIFLCYHYNLFKVRYCADFAENLCSGAENNRLKVTILRGFMTFFQLMAYRRYL